MPRLLEEIIREDYEDILEDFISYRASILGSDVHEILLNANKVQVRTLGESIFEVESNRYYDIQQATACIIWTRQEELHIQRDFIRDFAHTLIRNALAIHCGQLKALVRRSRLLLLSKEHRFELGIVQDNTEALTKSIPIYTVCCELTPYDQATAVLSEYQRLSSRHIQMPRQRGTESEQDRVGGEGSSWALRS